LPEEDSGSVVFQSANTKTINTLLNSLDVNYATFAVTNGNKRIQIIRKFLRRKYLAFMPKSGTGKLFKKGLYSF